MNWYQVFAKGHHGYPQPEDSYESELYETCCLRCGIRGRQTGSIQLRSPSKAPNSHFIQPNWLYDVFLVRPEVEVILQSEGIQGLELAPVFDCKKKSNSESLRQIIINTVMPCAETARLPKVTCMPKNEESGWELPGPKRYPLDTPYCGAIKFHSPTTLVLDIDVLKNAPDIIQTAEWFGSGGSSHRITICSERFFRIVKGNKLRGLGFNIIRFEGHSERMTKNGTDLNGTYLIKYVGKSAS
jgi:hypothetical protein